MKKTIFLLLFGTLYVIRGYPAGERTIAGGRALSMGGTSAAVSDFWSVSNNPAGTAWLSGVSAGAGFENRFLLPEIMQEGLGLTCSFKPGTIGITASRYGNSLYNELKAGVSVARKFGQRFSAGVRFNYLLFHVAHDYGRKSLVSCEIGLFYQAGKQLSLGVHLLNPVPLKIAGKPREQLPVVICIGLAYRFSADFTATVEADKDLANPAIFRAGAEYRLARPAWVRIGLATSPVVFTFGAGLEFGRFRFDLASSYHQALGFSPAGSLIYSFR